MSTNIYNDDKFLELTEKILLEKNKGNEKFKNQQNSEAESYYKNAIESAEDFFKNIPKSEKENLKENSFYQKFLNELKNSYSNLAAVYLRMEKYNEILEVDKFILSEIDHNFDKSYARMISAYHKLDQKDNAIDLYILMLKRFNKETMQKYEEQLKEVEMASKKKLEHYKHMYEKSKNQNSSGTSFFTSWKFKVLQAVIIGVIYVVYFFYFKGGLNSNNNSVNVNNKTGDFSSDKLNIVPGNQNELNLNLDLDNIKEEDLSLKATPEKTTKKDKKNNNENVDEDDDYKYDNNNANEENEDI
jgi:hypothetical protein